MNQVVRISKKYGLRNVVTSHGGDHTLFEEKKDPDGRSYWDEIPMSGEVSFKLRSMLRELYSEAATLSQKVAVAPMGCNEG